MIKVNWDKLPAQANYVALTDGYWHWFSEKPTYDGDDRFWSNEEFSSWGGAGGAISNAEGIEPENSLIQKEKPMTNKRHVHADLIIAWANGAEIEFKDVFGHWKDCSPEPLWELWTEYRIKQNTITKSVSFPEPMRNAPEIGQMYWVIDCDEICAYEWENTDFDNDSLLRGFIHYSEENAKLHLAAIESVKYPFTN